MSLKYGRNLFSKYEEGKIECLICGGWYKKICSHVVQRHDMTSREYKLLAGKDLKKGLMCEDSKELARKRNKENKRVVVQENLLNKGKQSRFKKGQKGLGKYNRSPQTMERLKQKSFIKKNIIY